MSGRCGVWSQVSRVATAARRPHDRGMLHFLATLAAALGLLATAFAWLWLLGQAFTESVPWGVACLLLPPASLAFVAVHWERARNPFLLQVLGVAAVLFAGWADHTALPAWVPSAW